MKKYLCLILLSCVLYISCEDPAAAETEDTQDFFVPEFDIPSAPDGQAGYSEAGTNGYLYYAGHILFPYGIYSGEMLINPEGTITYIGRDASSQSAYTGAAKVICEKGLAVPGLIDGRRHSGFTVNEPADYVMGDSRWDHRHEWRKGKNGTIKLEFASQSFGRSWDEAVMIMAGVTSVNVSGGDDVMVRDLTANPFSQGLGGFDTFPLGDSDGTMTTTLNDYSDSPSHSDLSLLYYSAVVAEGIGDEARNEFLSLADDVSGDSILRDNMVVMNGTGLVAEDYEAMAQEGVSLVWTPRSDLFLYGNTALVTAFDGYGGNIALGSIWTGTGSYNLLLELKRAKSYNDTYLGGYFTDQELIDMATINGAKAFGAENYIGSFQTGKYADFSIFALDEGNPYDSVFKADQEDVLLVVRGGDALYGDTYLIDDLASSTDQSESLYVNGATKRFYIERETGSTLTDLEDLASGISCLPFVFDKSLVDVDVIPTRSGSYDGTITTEDRDGDGIANGADNAPDIFNPIRPVDEGVQPMVEAE